MSLNNWAVLTGLSNRREPRREPKSKPKALCRPCTYRRLRYGVDGKSSCDGSQPRNVASTSKLCFIFGGSAGVTFVTVFLGGFLDVSACSVTCVTVVELVSVHYSTHPKCSRSPSTMMPAEP
jgi:hypothetical protein